MSDIAVIPALTPVADGAELGLPTLIGDAGSHAATRFVEFFTANIRNPNTRKAYVRAIGDFFGWCERYGVGPLTAIQPVHVAAYVEQLGRTHAAPTVKQRLAAIRMLFDWLIVGQVMAHNPAAAVRGPKHVVTTGKTPILSPAETRQLLDAIPTETITGYRDRALIGLLVYTFARIGAAVALDVEDIYHQNRRLWVRLNEKGGKQHAMPAHHNLEDYLHAYIDAGGLAGDPKGPLFHTVRGRGQALQRRRLATRNALDMVRRRADQAGLATAVTNHTFRATGITAYLKNGGTLEHAKAMAAHASTRTTQLYDRRSEEVRLDEVERIVI